MAQLHVAQRLTDSALFILHIPKKLLFYYSIKNNLNINILHIIFMLMAKDYFIKDIGQM